MREPVLRLILSLGGKELRFEKDGEYRIVSAEGLEAGQAEPDCGEHTFLDGGYAAGVRMKSRRISLVFEYDGGEAEEKRYPLLSFFVPGAEGELRVFRGERERVIGAMLTGVECLQDNLFGPLRFKVGLLCPDPYFKDAEDTVLPLRHTAPLLFAPLTSFCGDGVTSGIVERNNILAVNNDGDVPVGITARIEAVTGDVTDPFVSCLGKRVTVPGTLKAGDRLLISTAAGEKRIELNGERIVRFALGSEFFELPCGGSFVSIGASSGLLRLNGQISFRRRYLGA